MSTKHTPGPWTVSHTTGDIPLYLIDQEKSATNQETRGPNARLIAAAPEMLEALQLFDRYRSGECSDIAAEVVIKSAIAKATVAPEAESTRRNGEG